MKILEIKLDYYVPNPTIFINEQSPLTNYSSINQFEPKNDIHISFNINQTFQKQYPISHTIQLKKKHGNYCRSDIFNMYFIQSSKKIILAILDILVNNCK